MPTNPVPFGCPLTRVQFEILKRVCDGLTYDQIALERGCSGSTVRTHLNGIFTRLEVPGAIQAVVKMLRSGWYGYVPAPEPQLDETEKFPLSPAWRAYLAEFDAWMRTGSKRAELAKKILFAGARASTIPSARKPQDVRA